MSTITERIRRHAISSRTLTDVIIDSVRQRYRQHITDSESPIEQRLGVRANSSESMDKELLAAGRAELGPTVQHFCDHPLELQDEYFNGIVIHRRCECGRQLGPIEDQ